jgi:hypothetical protein
MKAVIEGNVEGSQRMMTITMPKEGAMALILVAVVATTVTVPAVSAQRAGRPQEVRLPGLGSPKADWQLLSYDGCRFAVPGSWHADADGSLATAPDGSNISIRMFRVTSWSAHKAQIRAAFGRVQAVHEDSDRRLWLEIRDQRRIQHYIDVANGLSVCSGLLEVRPGSTPDWEDIVKRIADSIGPAREKRPPEPVK